MPRKRLDAEHGAENERAQGNPNRTTRKNQLLSRSTKAILTAIEPYPRTTRICIRANLASAEWAFHPHSQHSSMNPPKRFNRNAALQRSPLLKCYGPTTAKYCQAVVEPANRKTQEGPLYEAQLRAAAHCHLRHPTDSVVVTRTRIIESLESSAALASAPRS